MCQPVMRELIGGIVSGRTIIFGLHHVAKNVEGAELTSVTYLIMIEQLSAMDV